MKIKDRKYLNKMNPGEKKQFNALVSEHKKHWDETHKYLDKAFREQSKKGLTESDKKKSMLMADKGFMHERQALKIGNQLDKFVDALKKKHGSTAMSSQERSDRKLITIYTRSSKTEKERIGKLKVRIAKYKKEGKTELYEKYKKKLNASKESLRLKQDYVKKLKTKYSS